LQNCASYAELGIVQSIFRSASRRETLGKHLKGGRRDGELKMDWTKPLPRAWPMCIECRLDLGWGPKGVGDGKRAESRGWLVGRPMGFHNVGGQDLSLGKCSQWAAWLDCFFGLARPS